MEKVLVAIWFVMIGFISHVDAQSVPTFYDCKTIKVSGARQENYNGLYRKVFECNIRAVYGLDVGGVKHFLFWTNRVYGWAIGTPTVDRGDCSVITAQYTVIGVGNKLYPHMVEPIWTELNEPNPDIIVECDDVHWTLGCVNLDFPLSPKLLSRCPNATSAIEVTAVHVVNWPQDQQELCYDAEKWCIGIGKCEINSQCRKELDKSDYEYQLVSANCNDRHVQCHSFRVRPLFHIGCDIHANFDCNVRPDIIDGLLIEYKCRRSYQFKSQDDAPVDIGDPVVQTVSTCTPVDNGISTIKPKEDNSDATLITYVAPAAAVIFLVIIISVIIVSVRRMRNSGGRPTTVDEPHKELPSYLTYENIPVPEIKEPFKRPDLAKKKPKDEKHDMASINMQQQGDMPPNILDAVAKAIANPGEKVGNGMYVVIVDKNSELGSEIGSLRTPGTSRSSHSPANSRIPRPHMVNPRSRTPRGSPSNHDIRGRREAPSVYGYDSHEQRDRNTNRGSPIPNGLAEPRMGPAVDNPVAPPLPPVNGPPVGHTDTYHSIHGPPRPPSNIGTGRRGNATNNDLRVPNESHRGNSPRTHSRQHDNQPASKNNNKQSKSKPRDQTYAKVQNRNKHADTNKSRKSTQRDKHTPPPNTGRLPPPSLSRSTILGEQNLGYDNRPEDNILSS